MDRTESTILQLAASVRRYLVQPGSDELLPGLNISLLRVQIPQQVIATEIYQEAVQAVLQDSSLIPLHPAPDGTPVTLSGSIMGVGSTVVNVPEQVVGAAAFEVAVTEGVLPIDALTKRALDYLRKMRRLAADETIEICVLAGLTGFSLPENATCHTPLGPIRPTDPRMQGPDSPWSIWSSHLGLPPPVVLTTTVSYHVDVVRPGTSPPDPKGNAFEDIPERTFPVRMAVLLASDQSMPLVRPRVGQVTAVLPHGGAFVYAPPGEAAYVGEPRSLTEGELDAAGRFVGVLTALDQRSIEVALRRTLSAASERRQETDMLIDAVTAWENLVGTETETSFRVTAALAILLEGDFFARSQRYKRLRKVYGARSKVVHGEHGKDSLARANAELAVNVALDALRVILIEEPWLLDLGTSQARADAILLGDPRLRRGKRL